MVQCFIRKAGLEGLKDRIVNGQHAERVDENGRIGREVITIEANRG